MSRTLIYVASSLSPGGLRQLAELCKRLVEDRILFDILAPLELGAEDMGAGSYLEGSPFRFISEINLIRIAPQYTNILCFSNLPAIFIEPKRQLIFLQNRNLIEGALRYRMDLKLAVKLFVQRMVLKLALRRIRMVVQTESMVYQLLKWGHSANLTYLIHTPTLDTYGLDLSDICEKKFFYPSSSEPHKNIEILIDAWHLLTISGVPARLLLTTDAPRLRSRVQRLFDFVSPFYGVEFLGRCTEQAVEELWKDADFFINPSFLESYGYALVDAKARGMPTVSVEMSYVRDILDPEYSFDPFCEFSVACAVSEAMGVRREFVSSLLADTEYFSDAFA